MRQAAELSREALIEIVETLQGHLYLDLSGSEEIADGFPPHSEYWNPDKSWSIDLLDSLADKLWQHDLVPTGIEPYRTETADEPTVHCDWSGYCGRRTQKEDRPWPMQAQETTRQGRIHGGRRPRNLLRGRFQAPADSAR